MGKVPMNERRRIEERLRKKEQEILDLEGQIKDSRIYVQALQDVLKMMPKDQDEAADPDSVLRPGSAVAQARAIILQNGGPVHVDEILRQSGKEVTRDTKAALSGSLAAYVRKREIFTRPLPNTFGLLEMEGTAPAVMIPKVKPPEGFGT